MAQVFISHSSHDQYFVDLLVEILNYHHVKTWYAPFDIPPGSKFVEEINEGISLSESLIIVISKNSIKSNWLTREITTYKTKKDEDQLIPVLLDPIDVDEIFEGLKEYHSIFFFENMLLGFKKLLAIFGKEFLPEEDKRSKQRRIETDIRKEERRKSPIVQRMRKGFWKTYSEATGRGKFEEFDMAVLNMMKIVEILQDEIKKYDYFDNNGDILTLNKSSLSKLIYEVWEELGERDYLTSVIVIEAIAEKLYNNYEVKKKEKRHPIDRRDIKDRRTDN
ncbi:toll/interleukin-1 receptor domain-containing protein [bacterium]|nr:toll/interleukin-1 receptor domain-containing protein [FCB group bacterium]MBL7190178.1 toll/interleukin-1 receptor domain-containing protein [bacterium]